MSAYTLNYTLTVEVADGGSATAYIDEQPTPLRGHGESPLQAIRALCETLREWPIGGADRWLTTVGGIALARQFVPGFESKPGRGMA